MDLKPKHDDLIDDLLSESAPTGFRSALLADTLRRARRRRWKRRGSRVTFAAAMVFIVGFLVWQRVSTESISVRPNVNYVLIETKLLPPVPTVTTQPLSAERMVATFTSIRAVNTRLSPMELRIINDDELLALAAPRIPALVRTGPHTQELILLRPEPDLRRVN
jgi:hypothetical protein